MLEIKDLHVNYGAVHALNGVSMTVNDGEIVSLIGANGAGKTTTLRTITGLEKAASGSITFDGHDLRKTEPSKIITLKLAHVPEGRHIFPQMTVEENLEMGAFTDPADMAKTMADVYERFPRLKERKRQLAGTLSGGEQQMLAVGRALMGKPKMILMDEPSMGLSPLLVKEIFEIIKEVNKQGITILLVEQNAKMALAISDRAYVLETGTITIGNRKATRFHPADGIAPKAFVRMCVLSSVADPTPEGKSVVELGAAEGVRTDPVAMVGVRMVKFTAETKCSGVDMPDGRRIRKGAAEAIFRIAAEHENPCPAGIAATVRTISENGGTPLVVCENERITGVIELQDIIKTGIRERFERLRRMGVKTVMVTGDNPLTAKYIAEKAGVDDFIAEARPEDKLEYIRREQQSGKLVAMMGDGTNDAPALNFANVGLSMGSGTSVAKDASDITLLDDSFASIATAVMWGRSLYRNIQRFVLFQLTINFAAITICFIGALFGTDMPLTVVQILWVNIIMDTFAAMAMASLPPNPEVMRDKPRPRDEFIITPAMARTLFTCGAAMVVVLLGMLFRWTILQGGLTVEQLTVFFSTFVFLQFWNMFNAKGFETRHSVFTCLGGCREFFLILAAIGVGQVLIVEFGGEVFRTEPLSWMQWAEVIGFTSLLAVGGEIIRAIHRKRKQLR